MGPDRVACLPGLMRVMGVQHIDVVDTIGVGLPLELQRTINVTLEYFALDRISGHSHDTYSQALADTIPALQMAAWQLDTSAVTALINQRTVR